MENLPEELAWKIVGRISPVDAARLSMMSKWLKYVADSDIVWNKFVPSDWAEMVMSNHNRKKDLFISLFLTPIFPQSHNGKLGFFIDKRCGNKCYIVVARNLIFPWGWENVLHLNYMFSPDSSSTEVVMVTPIKLMDIRGQIKVGILSPNIIYGAYLVYKLCSSSTGMRSLNAVVRVVEHETESEAETRADVVHLTPRSSRSTQSLIEANFPVTTNDGWLEILMGTFYNHPRYYRDHLEARLMELKHVGRGHSDFIVKAIHFKPYHEL